MKSKFDKNYVLLGILALAFVCMTLPTNALFGSLVDWFPQHIMFPDYFRNQFYQTGNLVPDFAFHIGGGQNIFNFSYYGLLNPIVLFSYLLPFVSMTQYLIFANVIIYIITGLLFYKWMKRHFDAKLSFFLSILILCASPLLFHLHRHFMFVSYMPFLLLAFMGVENYFEKGKSGLLIISVLFIILISYYYSIPSLLAIVLYGVFIYIKHKKEFTIQQFLIDGVKFVIPLLLSILMSAVLLVPTFYTILSGRSTGSSHSVVQFLLPKINLDSVLYSNYSMGLTALAVLALLYGFMDKKRENCFLSISIFVLLIFPMFSYILNGFLYVRDKVWIPFLPLFCLLIGYFVRAIFKKEVSKKQLLIMFVCIIWIFILGYHTFYFYLDAALVFICVILYLKFPFKKWLYIPLLIVPMGLFIAMNHGESYVKKAVYKDSIHSAKELDNILKNENDIVRTAHLKESLYNANKNYGANYYTASLYSSIYNPDYYEFYKNTFANTLSYRNRLITTDNRNLLLQMFMGQKYIYSDYGMLGYRKETNEIYKNEDVLPVAYFTDHILSEQDFERLSYPASNLALLKNVIVGSETINKQEIMFESVNLSYKISEQKNLKLEEKGNKYIIKANENNKLTLDFENDYSGKILLIDFKLGDEWDCSKGDSSITINHIKNTLTCKSWIYKNENEKFHYVIADDKLDSLTIQFNKGDYIVSDIHVYALDYKSIKDINKLVTNFNFDLKKTKDNKIVGNIEVDKDGYFVTSIPYDDSFILYDNGKKISTEKVNTAFVGAKMKKGSHHIVLEYHAKGLSFGKRMSLVGISLCIIYLVLERKRKK